MERDEISALVTDWARTFDVKLTATQHMGLQLELRKRFDGSPRGCMHVNLRTAGAGMICLECGAYLDLRAE